MSVAKDRSTAATLWPSLPATAPRSHTGTPRDPMRVSKELAEFIAGQGWHEGVGLESDRSLRVQNAPLLPVVNWIQCWVVDPAEAISLERVLDDVAWGSGKVTVA